MSAVADKIVRHVLYLSLLGNIGHTDLLSSFNVHGVVYVAGDGES